MANNTQHIGGSASNTPQPAARIGRRKGALEFQTERAFTSLQRSLQVVVDVEFGERLRRGELGAHHRRPQFSGLVVRHAVRLHRGDIVGREAPKDVVLPPNVVFHGRLRDNAHIVRDADLILCNGGFSAVSEAFALRKPMVVLPIPNHAEQWVNGRTIEKLGVGFMAGEDEIERAMLSAVGRVDELRAAYRKLPPMRDGAAEAASLIIELAGGRRIPAVAEPERV